MSGGSARRKAAAYIHRKAQAQNKCTETSMTWVRFEPTIPAFERAKTVHALDRTAIVIGWSWSINLYNKGVWKQRKNAKFSFGLTN
jgi:hypothetical protein